MRVDGTARRHRMPPERRSRHSVMSSPLSAAVRKMCFSVRTGEESPAGISVFQTRFFCGPNSAGRSVSRIPEPLGPRKRSHVAAYKVLTDTTAASMTCGTIWRWLRDKIRLPRCHYAYSKHQPPHSKRRVYEMTDRFALLVSKSHEGSRNPVKGLPLVPAGSNVLADSWPFAGHCWLH